MKIHQEYIDLFHTLIEHSENEVVEFKKAERNFDTDDLGKYFSALSNEANLRGLDFAWLIMGYHEPSHTIIGTTFKNSEEGLNKLKYDIGLNSTDKLTFRDIIPISVEGKRLLMFKIPAAPRNIVVKWKGIAYGRNGESLIPLNESKSDEIRYQSPRPDWSAELVPTATIGDLDELALATARIMYKKVHSSTIPASEVDGWTTEEFLCHSEMMRDGKLTRAAILLLGNPLALQKIHPANAQITWVWKDKDGNVVDYEHFSIPYILTVDKIFGKIRNKTMRELPGGTLFPDTMKQYEDYSIREALHNCIAHQDYTLGGRITVVENEGYLFYSNKGSFIPKTIEKVLKNKGPQSEYRNTCLAHGMVHFNMIDTVGRGIPKMFNEQRRRFFPMPEYEIDTENKSVSVTIYGISSNDEYTDLLKSDSSLSLMECLWLDAVRRHKPITKEAAKHLKERNLIEGKAPRYNIALSVAQKTQQVGHYTKETGLNKTAIIKLVLQLGVNSGKIGFKRSDVLEMLELSLPANMTKTQKLNHVSNMLRSMQTSELLSKTDNGRRWIITDKGRHEI
ncbi:MAG: putative DNA binding domain-containing protein [Muribaculaceae bacterium]|nr:putative DNA binding domain-containing protein [Muribaculaceae bacterium]